MGEGPTLPCIGPAAWCRVTCGRQPPRACSSITHSLPQCKPDKGPPMMPKSNATSLDYRQFMNGACIGIRWECRKTAWRLLSYLVRVTRSPAARRPYAHQYAHLGVLRLLVRVSPSRRLGNEWQRLRAGAWVAVPHILSNRRRYPSASRARLLAGAGGYPYQGHNGGLDGLGKARPGGVPLWQPRP